LAQRSLDTLFIPLLAWRLCGAGVMTGALSDVGIDDKFVQRVQTQVTPGTSALFLVSEGGLADRIIPAIRNLGSLPD
jgi:uncharacterized membrane protein